MAVKRRGPIGCKAAAFAGGRGRAVFVWERPDLCLGVGRQVFSRGPDIFGGSSSDGVAALVR
jgi:hypothetical protein